MRSRYEIANQLSAQLISSLGDRVEPWIIRAKVFSGMEKESAAQVAFDQALRLAEAQLEGGVMDRCLALAELALVHKERGELQQSDSITWEAITLKQQRLAAQGEELSLLQTIAAYQQILFTGGPPQQFEEMGRYQRDFLQQQGLLPEHRLLDIGCGSLRAGCWLIPYLESDRYHGIEPNRVMLRFGREILLKPELLSLKRPSFDHNTRFDFSVFGAEFDFYVARSIWSHASKPQILRMLQQFKDTSAPGAQFFASYLPATEAELDYGGEAWVGRSHSSSIPGLCRHQTSWIVEQCEALGLVGEEVDEPAINDQVWFRVRAR